MTHRYSPTMTSSDRGLLTRVVRIACASSLAISVSLTTSATADDPPQPAPAPAPVPVTDTKPAESPATPSTTPPANAPRSLDDLLGVPKLPGSSGSSNTGSDIANSSAEDAARREQDKRLERSLDEASMDDLVQKAIAGMKDASTRLSDAKDPGLGTQRIQEDVVKTLDRLLEEAQRRQNKQQSSSSKKKSGKQQKKDEPSEQNGQQQRQRQPGQREQAPKPGDDGQPPDGGTRDDAVAAIQELTETRIEWGQLPERVRELVLQGRRDRVSSIYERLTREYYRRLAEEASR